MNDKKQKVRCGFNMLWMFGKREAELPLPSNPEELDFIASEGFNFIRIPMDYRFLCPGFDYFHPKENVLERIDTYLEACRVRGLHVSLNLHRAPGYCINRPETEKHNLWRDQEALDGFIFLWRMFAERYLGIPGSELSFDLINEPDQILPTHPCTRKDHERVIRAAVETLREADPNRPLAIDGWGGGHYALPELKDLGIRYGVTHSGRGYTPFPLTHYRAEWVRDREKNPPMPDYPGISEKGERWDIQFLRRFYEPWKQLNEEGVPVHIGEFGCYNKVDNAVALRWFEDLITVFRENGWGYGLWNFKGPFGIVEHGRPGTKYENHRGFLVDRALLEILKSGL